jgi:hypothetical protein
MMAGMTIEPVVTRMVNEARMAPEAGMTPGP